MIKCRHVQRIPMLNSQYNLINSHKVFRISPKWVINLSEDRTWCGLSANSRQANPRIEDEDMLSTAKKLFEMFISFKSCGDDTTKTQYYTTKNDIPIRSTHTKMERNTRTTKVNNLHKIHHKSVQLNEKAYKIIQYSTTSRSRHSQLHDKKTHYYTTKRQHTNHKYTYKNEIDQLHN